YVVSITVLVWLLDVSFERKRRIASAAQTGWWFGLGYLACGLYWISSAFIARGAAFAPWGIPATLALAGALAIFFAVGGAIAMALWARDARRVLALAIGLFISEWLRGNILTGFPWILPGYVWTPGEPVSQIASLVGIYGLSLVTLAIAAAPATIADRMDGAKRFAPALAAALAVGMLWGWGAQRIAHAPVDPPGAQPMVRVADSGLTQQAKWCEGGTMAQRYACASGQEWRVLQRYLDASGPAEDSRTDILVWPEGAIPPLNFFQLDNQTYLDALGRGLGDRVLIVGLTRCAPRRLCDAYMQGGGEVDDLHLFNSGAVIDGVSGQARVAQIYDKHHLVPFGEYIPFWPIVRRLGIAPLQEIGAGFDAGAPPERLVIPGAPPALVLICYEAIFPGLTPHGPDRPGWIANISNDAWFGDLRWFTGPYQHFAMARYRSIEEGLPMARAASGGISAIVDSYGRVIRSTQAGGRFAEAQLPPTLPETVFATLGSILTFVLLVILVALRFVLPRQETTDNPP
ncbi:MAG: apolipoprotein N-acyltransferase, partial [Proteobacteria bacterium]|nr:apolipoprotein N-acyltransferase [Pseudomonadota bacterium]